MTPVIGFNLGVLREALEVVPDAALACEPGGNIICCNSNACRLLGCPEEELMGKDLAEFVPAIAEWAESGGFLSMVRFGELDSEYAIKTAGGGERVVWSKTNVITTADRKARYVVLSLRDVTSKSRLEERLRALSVTDELTGLFNRRYLHNVLPFEEERSRRYGQMLSCAFIDVDKFKLVNDTLGHHVGDLALKAIADLMQGNARKIDTICRWGGDEFVILSLVKDKDGMGVFLNRLCESVSLTPVEAGEHRLNLSISCGAAVGLCTPGLTGNQLVEKADELLLKAKREGRNQAIIEELS